MSPFTLEHFDLGWPLDFDGRRDDRSASSFGESSLAAALSSNAPGIDCQSGAVCLGIDLQPELRGWQIVLPDQP